MRDIETRIAANTVTTSPSLAQELTVKHCRELAGLPLRAAQPASQVTLGNGQHTVSSADTVSLLQKLYSFSYDFLVKITKCKPMLQYSTA